MSLRTLSDAKTVSLTPLDEARSGLAALVYEADQVHRDGGTLTAQALRELSAGCAEVLSLQQPR